MVLGQLFLLLLGLQKYKFINSNFPETYLAGLPNLPNPAKKKANLVTSTGKSLKVLLFSGNKYRKIELKSVTCSGKFMKLS